MTTFEAIGKGFAKNIFWYLFEENFAHGRVVEGRVLQAEERACAKTLSCYRSIMTRKQKIL